MKALWATRVRKKSAAACGIGSFPWELLRNRGGTVRSMWGVLAGRRRAGTHESAGRVAGPVVDGAPLRLVPASALLGERLLKRLVGMRLESGLEADEFNRLIREPMAACADWVQQLPATREAHHCEAGGLVRMAVECAAVAMRRADGKLFETAGSGPAGGVRHDTAWRYAAALGALFAAVGHGVGRWRVRSQDGVHTWGPYERGLSEWLSAVGGRAYRVSPAPPAHGIGRAGAPAWIAARCLSTGSLARLQHGQGEAMGALLDVLGGHTGFILGGIVQDAIEAVIAEDRARARPRPAGASPPEDQRLLTTMKRLVRSRWRLNQAEGRLMLGPDGVYLGWKRAGEDLLSALREDHPEFAADSVDDLAARLLEHGLVDPNADAPGGPSALFEVRILSSEGGPDVGMDCVRLADPRVFELDISGEQPLNLCHVAREPAKMTAVEDVPGRAPPDAGAAVDDGPHHDDVEREWAASGAADPNAADANEPATGTAADGSRRSPARATGAETPADRALERALKAAAAVPDEGPDDTPECLPALAKYGSVGRVLSRIAAQSDALERVPEGLAVRRSALKKHMPPRHFVDQARQQGVIVPCSRTATGDGRKAGRQPYIVLAPHVVKLLGIDPAVAGSEHGR